MLHIRNASIGYYTSALSSVRFAR